MQFLKKHYEKVILSVVLLGLAVAAAALPLEVNRVSQFLEDTTKSVVRTTAKPFKPVDLSTNMAVVKRFENPAHLNFAQAHNLFNPVVWLKKPDGGIYKSGAGDSGPSALIVSKIDELKLTVSYEGVGGTPDKPQYQFVVVRDTDPNPKRTQLATPRLKNALFELLEVRGPAEAPTALVVRLKEEKQPIAVAKDKPYSRVIGFAADLKYPPDSGKSFNKKRVKDPIQLKGDTETYKIVAIDRNVVVLSADSTQKRTTLKWNPAP